ncbi:deoxynucleoside kinase [Thalassotalea insulae]|uniref:diguanylate cyclase n=1 Tax=Thalassotalea insulae TaxID=2056778 RepID=A0ABQ6GR80_9GAMM|nr:diguanylate cyclase [Thalassotalea insulae]GLX78447.1 deoxynucleoside kinase [Thalassotalea insulae]
MRITGTLLLLVSVLVTDLLCASELTVTDKSISVQYFVLPSSQAQSLPIDKVLTIEQQFWQQQAGNRVPITEPLNWLAVKLTNHTKQEAHFQLVLTGGEYIFAERFFVETPSANVKSLVSERELNNLIHSAITLTSEQTITVYLALSSPMADFLTLELMSEVQFSQFLAAEYLSLGLAVGSLFAFAVILLFVAFANKQQMMFLLAGYYLLQSLLLAVIYGVNLHTIFPGLTLVRGLEIPVLTSLSVITLLGFSGQLFNLAARQPKIYQLFCATAWLMLFNIGLSIFLPLNVNFLISQLLSIVSIVLLGVLVKTLLRGQDRLAKLFTGFVVIQALVVIVNVLLVGWFDFDALTYTFGNCCSGLFIVYLLARQSALQIDKKYSAQRAALESEMQSKQVRDELIELQARTQEQLESRVQERTFELNIALQELEEANRELAQKNTLDELTGLYNRRFYDQKMLAEFRRSRRNLTPLSLVIIDIDYFKKINDNYGHSAGDNCLVTLAKTIQQLMRRSTDIACRYGGEEFCLILPETDNAGAVALANELREKVIAQIFDIGVTELSLTISCGVSTYQHQADVQPVDIFNAADKALYQAKENGRNQVVNKEILSGTVAQEENE